MPVLFHLPRNRHRVLKHATVSCKGTKQFERLQSMKYYAQFNLWEMYSCLPFVLEVYKMPPGQKDYKSLSL